MQITDALKAVTDITRLRMIRLLVSKRVEIGVSEFVDSLQGLPYNVSKQLKILEQAELVRSRKEGRNVYYRLGTDDAAVIDRLLQLIASLPDAGGDFASDLRRYDRHVERGMEAEEMIVDEDIEPESPDEGEEEIEELPSHLL